VGPAHAEVVDVRFRRYHPRLAVAAGVVAAVVVGTASWHALADRDPEPPSDEAFLAGPPPGAGELSGVWRVAGTPALLLLRDDGTAQYDDAGRLLGEVPAVLGDWVAGPGGEITLHVEGGAAGCDDQTITMRTALVEPGWLRVVPTHAGREGCASLSGRQTLEQVLPPGPQLLALDPGNGAGWDPPTGSVDLVGTWVSAGGTGDLLELRTDRSYTVLTGTGRIVDEGTWALGVPGFHELRLSSGSASRTCQEDDLFVLGSLRVHRSGGEVEGLAGAAAHDDCGAGWPDRWLRVSG
jgi:hypothetical protein